VTITAPPHDVDALRLALQRHRYAAIACASQRAAEALAAAAGGAALGPVWAVGPATAAALEAGGLTALRDPAVHDGESLGRAVVASLPPRSLVLVPRAEDGRDELVTVLREAGHAIHAITAYRTVAASLLDPEIREGRELLATGRAAVCGVFAPSQARALDELVVIATIDTLFAAIGETTAAALREAGARRVVVAREPTPEGLANAVAAVYPTQR
jgi:uroporphyrinogen-III synthase